METRDGTFFMVLAIAGAIFGFCLALGWLYHKALVLQRKDEAAYEASLAARKVRETAPAGDVEAAREA